MNVGVVGLGLIGGSFAKAYKHSGHTVFACDIDETILDFAMISGEVDDRLTEETVKICDLILIAILPEMAAEYFEKNAMFMSKNSVIIDCCGTKAVICERCFEIAEKYNLTFIGGHPMAGSHKSGFKNSDGELFKNAPMVLVPPVFDNPGLISKTEKLLSPAGFGKFSVTTAQKHDEMIAFTSQLAHIVSNAYVKSPNAANHNGFSAGSYKDLTRVAWLNPQMWAELLLENSHNVLNELESLISSLGKYREAIAENNKDMLIDLLEEGKKRKEQIDG